MRVLHTVRTCTARVCVCARASMCDACVCVYRRVFGARYFIRYGFTVEVRLYAEKCADSPRPGSARYVVALYTPSPSSFPLPVSPPPPPFPRSNGSRGVPGGILLTTHIHSLNIPTLPMCAVCQYIYKYTNIHIYIYTLYYTIVHTHTVVYSRVPRVSATSAPPRFPLLRYWHIPLSSHQGFSTRPYPPPPSLLLVFL